MFLGFKGQKNTNFTGFTLLSLAMRLQAFAAAVASASVSSHSFLAVEKSLSCSPLGKLPSLTWRPPPPAWLWSAFFPSQEIQCQNKYKTLCRLKDLTTSGTHTMPKYIQKHLQVKTPWGQNSSSSLLRTQRNQKHRSLSSALQGRLLRRRLW